MPLATQHVHFTARLPTAATTAATTADMVDIHQTPDDQIDMPAVSRASAQAHAGGVSRVACVPRHCNNPDLTQSHNLPYMAAALQIHSFCIAAGIAIFFVFVITVTQFLGLMVLDTKRATAGRYDLLPCLKRAGAAGSRSVWVQLLCGWALPKQYCWPSF